MELTTKVTPQNFGRNRGGVWKEVAFSVQKL